MFDSLLDTQNFMYFYQRQCAQRTRGLVVISGEQSDCENIALQCLKCLDENTEAGRSRLPADWIANDLSSTGNSTQINALCRHIHQAKAQVLLGSSLGHVVLNAYDGFNPNLLGIVSGALASGGLLFLITPPLAVWAEYNDPDYARFSAIRPPNINGKQSLMHGGFLRRSANLLENKKQLGCKAENDFYFIDASVKNTRLDKPATKILSDSPNVNIGANSAVSISASTLATQTLAPQKEPIQATHSQQAVIQSMLALAKQKHAALLLSADRGRGKSAALGFAIAELLQASDTNVVISSPHRANVNALFDVLTNCCTVDAWQQRVKFVAVDQLIYDLTAASKNNQSVSDWVVIDEAAAIALPLLQTIASSAAKVVFSSTTHGYEGSGRGFLLRFKAQLEREFKTFKHLSLTEPIRWSAQDALEPFFSRLLCLADHSGLAASGRSLVSLNKPLQVTVHSVSKAQLLASEQLLQAVVALLVDAHYQTKPSDLRYLLDTPYTKLWLAETSSQGQSHLVGALLVCEEGGLAQGFDSLLDAVVAGKRRPQGNMMAQLLSYQAGQSDWCRMLSWRVMRIAVAAPFRRQGIAMGLIDAMQKAAKAAGCSYWGSSFGFDLKLIEFWQRCQTLPVHLGLHLDKASGARNLAVIKPMSAQSKSMTEFLSLRLVNNLPFMQGNYLKALPNNGVNALIAWSELAGEQYSNGDFLHDDARMLQRFTDGEIGFDLVFAAFCRKLKSGQQLKQAEPVSSSTYSEDMLFLTQVMRAAPNWSALSKQFALTGRRQVLERLRSCLSKMS